MIIVAASRTNHPPAKSRRTSPAGEAYLEGSERPQAGYIDRPPICPAGFSFMHANDALGVGGDHMVPEHPNRIARVGSVLALLGSLIWVQLPIDFTRFNVAAVILFIAAFVTWVSIEISDFRIGEKVNDNILSEDVSKLNSIIKLIDKNQYHTLKQKAIQTYMDDDDYDGIKELMYYHENDIFPFHNKKIQELYQKFSHDAHDFFFEFYTLYTSDGRGRSTWRSPGEGYVSDEIYEEVRAKIAVLNKKASKLAELWEELISVSRQELKGASKAIERYEM